MKGITYFYKAFAIALEKLVNEADVVKLGSGKQTFLITEMTESLSYLATRLTSLT